MIKPVLPTMDDDANGILKMAVKDSGIKIHKPEYYFYGLNSPGEV